MQFSNQQMVKDMKKLYARGRSQAEIARVFGIDPSGVSLIVRGKSWAHIK